MGKTMVKEKIIIVLILVFAFLLRLININQSFWLDEAAQAIMSSNDIKSIFFERSGDFHPPLFYLISHYWINISKNTEFLRLLPISFGVINVLVVYYLAKFVYPKKTISIKSFNIKVENLSAFLLAIAPFHIYYSQEFRSYSLLCLLGTVSFIPLLNKQFIRLGLIWSLLLYTHYSSIFLIISQIIYVLFYDKPNIKKLVLSIMLTVLLFLPWSPQFYKQINSGLSIKQNLPGWSSILSISPIKATPQIFFKIIAGRINIYPKYIYYSYVFLVLLIFIISSLLVSHKQKLLFTWVFLPLILMIITSFIFPQNQPFRLIFILPGIVFIFIEAMFKSPKTFLLLILYISIFGNLMYFTRTRLQREDWLSLTELINDSKTPTIVKFPEAFAPIKWYLPDANIISTGNIPVDKNFFASTLSSKNPDRVYLLEYLGDLTDPNREVDKVLVDKNYKNINTYNIMGVGFVYLYSK